MSAEELLRKVLEHFYVNTEGGLEWVYDEGASIGDVLGADFEQALHPYLSPKQLVALEAARSQD